MNRVNKTNRKHCIICFTFLLVEPFKETFTDKYNGILPITPLVRPKSEIYTPKRHDDHPRPFHMGKSNWHSIFVF